LEVKRENENALMILRKMYELLDSQIAADQEKGGLSPENMRLKKELKKLITFPCKI
jgi:hypothetical protein